MSRTNRSRGLVVMTVAMLLFFAALVAYANQLSTTTKVVTGQGAATETPAATIDLAHYSHPITTTAQAITKCESLYRDIAFTQTDAKLMTMALVDQWAEGESPFISTSAPVWLVALVGSGHTVKDILAEYEGDGRPIEGAYCILDANSGSVLGLGALGNPWPQTFATYSQLPNQSLVIVTATVTFASTVMPDYTPTP